MRRKREDLRQLKLVLPESSDIQHLSEENSRLRAENGRLKAQITVLTNEVERLGRLVATEAPQHTRERIDSASSHSDAYVQNSPEGTRHVTKRSPIEDKISLFRSYFRGRQDVYAVQAIKQDGKVQYYPKRLYIRTEEGNGTWGDNLPLTDEAIRAHLQDEKNPVTVGLYPLLLDETCSFLAIDFDKTSWKDDAAAFLETCNELHVSAALERSRSGNGGHVWIFFDDPISARTARALGATLLTRTLEKRHHLGLDSYDRMFPNQDTLPKEKQLGNLIALPLQRMAGKAGNSLFIDRDGNPYADQWVYLSSVRKMTATEVQRIVTEANLHGNVIAVSNPIAVGKDSPDPWNRQMESHSPFTPTFPSNIKIVLSDMLYVHKQGLSSSLINWMRQLAAFQNPEFYKAQAMRLSTYGKPRVIDCSEEFPDYIALPRGCYDELAEVLEFQNVQVEVDDKRNGGLPIDVIFHGKLREDQMKAANHLSDHDIGTLAATTAFGKTVVGAWMIAARSANTLVLVDKVQLLEQWRERISLFLNIPVKEIGMIGGGRSSRTGKIDVALIQSVYANRQVKEYVADYGHIIVDECHHISAVSFEQVLRRSKAKYVLGLTATLTRKDGKHPIVLMQCGPVRFKVDAKSQAKKRPFEHIVIARNTAFRLPDTEANLGIQQIYDWLISDESRNDMIFDDLLKSLDAGRSPILLTNRTSHLEYFESRLKGFAKNIIVLRGGMGKKQWKATQERIKSIPANEERVILATGKFVGEGFDDERLDTLFLVTPISWKGTLQQYAGRLHRLYDLKNEVQIYDYVDDQVPTLSRMYQTRLKGYKAMGYTERSPQRKDSIRKGLKI